MWTWAPSRMPWWIASQRPKGEVSTTIAWIFFQAFRVRSADLWFLAGPDLVALTLTSTLKV